MNLRRVSALSKKEFIQIRRDPRSLILAIFIPLLLLFLFGYALTLDVDNIPLVIWNQDKSQVSTDFIRDFKSSRYFKIVGYFDDYTGLQNYIDRNKSLMALVIPRDFSKLILSERTAPVQLLVDGSDSNTATIAMGYVDALVSGYNVKLLKDLFREAGIKTSFPVEFEPRVWFNEDLKSRNFIIPGLIAVIMMIIAALLTSLTVAREWERGTMEQLISTPVKAEELIMGKFFPYFLIGVVDLLIAVVIGQFIFKVPFRGSLILLFILSDLFLAGAMMQGILISIVAKNQQLATQLAFLTTFLPGFLLSGFAYAISNMPKVIQAITHLVPARYFIVILKGIYLKGVGLNVLWLQTLLLFLFTFVMINLARAKFKKKIA